MSLDVYLTEENATEQPYTPRIYVREDGRSREITQAEWDERFPGREPVMLEPMEAESDEVYSANITHNLNVMARQAGIYQHLWRPEELGITRASQLIEPLRAGLELLTSDPERFAAFNPSNGWGNYDGLVSFVADYLAACEVHPGAQVRVWR